MEAEICTELGIQAQPQSLLSQDITQPIRLGSSSAKEVCLPQKPARGNASLLVTFSAWLFLWKLLGQGGLKQHYFKQLLEPRTSLEYVAVCSCISLQQVMRKLPTQSPLWHTPLCEGFQALPLPKERFIQIDF